MEAKDVFGDVSCSQTLDLHPSDSKPQGFILIGPLTLAQLGAEAQPLEGQPRPCGRCGHGGRPRPHGHKVVV